MLRFTSSTMYDIMMNWDLRGTEGSSVLSQLFSYTSTSTIQFVVKMWHMKRWCVMTIIHYCPFFFLAPECCHLLRATDTSVHDSDLGINHVDLWDVTKRSHRSSRTNGSNDDYKKDRCFAKWSIICQDLSPCKRRELYKSFHQKHFSFTKRCLSI